MKAEPKAIIILTPFRRSTFTTGNYHTGVINSHVLRSVIFNLRALNI